MYDKLERDLRELEDVENNIEKELEKNIPYEIPNTYICDIELLKVLKDYIKDNDKFLSSDEISDLIKLYHDLLNGGKNRNG